MSDREKSNTDNDVFLANLVKNVLYPYGNEMARKLLQSNCLLAHYTSPKVAYNILTKGEIWLRSAKDMNDFSEIEWGMDSLAEALQLPEGERFWNEIEALFPGLPSKVMEQFSSVFERGIRYDSYMTSFTIHSSHEHRYGRLSMWRAYPPIAIVFKPWYGFKDTVRITNIHMSPVLYGHSDMIAPELAAITKGIAENKHLLSKLGNEKFKTELLELFRFCVLSTKHPAFREEQEWRMIHWSPHKMFEKSPFGLPIPIDKGLLQPSAKPVTKEIDFVAETPQRSCPAAWCS